MSFSHKLFRRCMAYFFLRCHARLKSPLRTLRWQKHVIRNNSSFVLVHFKLLHPAVVLLWDEVHEGFLLILLFVTIFQKCTSTLRIFWTRRYCFITNQNGYDSSTKISGCPRCTHCNSLLLCEYDIHCSLFLHNILLRRLSIRHMRNKSHMALGEINGG